MNKSGIHIKKSHEGKLHEALGIPQDEKIPAAKIEQAAHSKSPEMRKMANFAKVSKHWSHK